MMLLAALLALAAAVLFSLSTVRRSRLVRAATTRRAGAALAALAIAAAMVVMVPGIGSAADVPTVALGTAGNYSVLGAETVTNTGDSVLHLSLGLWPGTSITGFPPGVVDPPAITDATNAAAQQAQSDLTAAYLDAAGRSIDATTTADLGGLILTQGVYAGPAKSPLSITGTLTLDAAGDPSAVFIFQTDSSLTTASGSAVSLVNGAQACNVFWQVGSSATLGTGSAFAGSILALESITVTTGATVRGRALARNAAVTLDTNVFTVPSCRLAPWGNIVVDKVTDPAGSDIPFEFAPDWADNFFLADADAPYDSGLMAPGTYSVAEVNLPEGWELTSAICSNGSDPAAITLGSGETVLCTFTNTEELPPTASLTIIKDARPADNTVFWFDGGSLTSFSLKDPADSTIHFTDLEPGAYTITELTTGLAATWQFESVECDALDWSATGQAVTVNLSQGEAAVCTFTNAEELPNTGMAPWMMPIVAAGLGAMLLGMLMLVRSRRRPTS
jgi:LPXTG-motif cell wall-anchored protein